MPRISQEEIQSTLFTLNLGHLYLAGCDMAVTAGLCLANRDPVPGLRVQNVVSGTIHWPEVVFGE